MPLTVERGEEWERKRRRQNVTSNDSYVCNDMMYEMDKLMKMILESQYIFCC